VLNPEVCDKCWDIDCHEKAYLTQEKCEVLGEWACIHMEHLTKDSTPPRACLYKLEHGVYESMNNGCHQT
jgi:hypothetical protein